MSQTSYYHYDGLGSTQLLTDEDGNVTDSYANTAFGEPVSTGAANPTPNPFQYVGQLGSYLDADTGDCYVRARVYRPVLARWLSQDPKGFAAHNANLYRYVVNRPTSSGDPSGLEPLWPPYDPIGFDPNPPAPPFPYPIVMNPQPAPLPQPPGPFPPPGGIQILPPGGIQIPPIFLPITQGNGIPFSGIIGSNPGEFGQIPQTGGYGYNFEYQLCPQVIFVGGVGVTPPSVNLNGINFGNFGPVIGGTLNLWPEKKKKNPYGN